MSNVHGLGGQAGQRASITKGDFLKTLMASIGGVDVPLRDYEEDPIGMARNVVGINYLTKSQEEILISVRDNRETNVPAGFNVGKTFIAAFLVVWWVFAKGGLGVSTAPTKRQVESLLWREIRKLYDRNVAKLGGHRTTTRVIYNEAAQAWGFTASKHEEEAAAGIHEQFLLGVMDEASGISRAIDDAFRGWLGGYQNRGLRIGNPIRDGTPFAEACMKKGCIRISCFDHPNVSWAYDVNGEMLPDVAAHIMTTSAMGNPEVMDRDRWASLDFLQRHDPVPGATSVEWIEETRFEKGVGSPFWDSRVLGLFPSDAATSVVPRQWFLAARQRYDENPEHWERHGRVMPWSYGLDVGDGIDDHALTHRRGDLLLSVETRATTGDRRDVGRAAGLLNAAFRRNDGAGTAYVDQIGVGAGALSNVLAEGHKAIGIHFGARARGSKARATFENLRGQLYWQLRERFQRGDIAIRPLGRDEERLMNELASVHWEYSNTGRIKVESKDDIRERLGHSPDIADSVAYAFATLKDKSLSGVTLDTGTSRVGSPWRIQS